MTTFQPAAKVLAAIKRETTFATAVATVTGATQMRILSSPGLVFNRQLINVDEKRSDQLTAMARLGYKSVTGSFNHPLTVGGDIDMHLESILRGVWATSTSITFASVTSITTGTNQVVANGGDWVGSQGVRVGDIFFLTNHSTSGNNGKNLRVVAATSLTLTVATGALTADAVADATGTLTILKKCKTPTTPTPYTHNIEQNDTTIDLTELMLGNMLAGLKLSFKPGQQATMQTTWMGADRTALATGTSPFFTSPSLTTSLQLISEDSAVRFNGAIAATFTGFDLDFTLAVKGEPVIGALVTPAMFDNDLNVTGTITALRSDFAALTLLDAETEFDISILLQEPAGTATPPAALSVFLPRCKLAKVEAPFGGGDGGKIETWSIITGPKATATGYDPGVCTFHSSGA